MQILTEAELRALLIRKCHLHGTAAMARRLGVSRAYLINIKRGRVGLGEKLFAAAGVEPVFRLTDAGKTLWG